MNRRWLVPAIALGLVGLSLGWLFSVRLGGGTVYPEYSSMRADALGTRALYEALETMPGVAVKREFRALDRLGSEPRVLLISGVSWRSWRSLPQDEFAALNRALQNGSRVVVAFRPYRVFDQEWQQRIERELDEAERKAAEKRKKESASEDAKKDDARAEPRESSPPRKQPPARRGPVERPRIELDRAWGAKVNVRAVLPPEAPATLAVGVMDELPAALGWHSEVALQLEAEAGWRAVYRRGGNVVLAEKQIGRGTLVLVGDAYLLSNEAMHRERATTLLAWLLGGHQRVTFLESHLGVAEDKGIGTLARRYGLGGALAMAALLAGLYAWRRLVAFYPLRDEVERDGVITLGHEPTAGLVALLRRSLPLSRVLHACAAEWRKQPAAGGSAAARERFEAALRDHPAGAAPIETYNQLVRALKRR